MLTIMACIKFVRSELLSENQQSANAYALNPYDLYMLGQLLELKKMYPCRVIGVTMSPKGCLEPAQRLIAMGLDDIYFVSDPCFAGSDTYSTSYILHEALSYIGQADIYAFGEKSIDGETSQVSIGVSGLLNLLCITGVEKIISRNNNIHNIIEITRIMMDQKEIVEVICPCAVCFCGFTTKEPDISLLQLKKSRGHMPIILDSKSLQIDKQCCGQSGSKTNVIQMTNLLNKKNGKLIKGSHQDKADILNELIFRGGIHI